MVDGADDRVDDALLAQRPAPRWPRCSPGRARRRAPAAQRLAQALGVRVDQRADALVERRVGRDVRARRAPGRSPEEALARRASANSSTSCPRPASAPGDRQRVHDAAARQHGVGQHRDVHAIALAASRAAAALDGATTRRHRAAPRPGAGRPAGRRRSRRRARRPRRGMRPRATTPRQLGGRIGVPPWPQQTGEDACGPPVAGRPASRRLPAVPGSTIGAGAPACHARLRGRRRHGRPPR